jgi:hypothetical protein
VGIEDFGKLNQEARVASTDTDWEDMILAENETGRERLAELIRSRRVRIYPAGTRVKIKKIAPEALWVKIMDGPEAGRSGWVQREFVKPE